MGYFEPCIPVHIHEFHERNIWFDYKRYTKPFITDQVLYDLVGDEADYFKQKWKIIFFHSRQVSMITGQSKNYSILFQMLFCLKQKIQMASNFIFAFQLNQ